MAVVLRRAAFFEARLAGCWDLETDIEACERYCTFDLDEIKGKKKFSDWAETF